MYVQFAFYGVSRKNSSQGGMKGPKNEKKKIKKITFLQLFSFFIQMTLKINTEA